MSNHSNPRSPTITEEVYLATIKMHVARIEALENALRFYARAENWASPSLGFALQYDPELAPLQKDRGTLARAALAEEKK